MSEFQLILGDSMEHMAGMADASVDHVITDPPYGADTHTGARTRKGFAAGHVTGGNTLVDFQCITVNDFLGMCRETVRIARRWVIMTCEWRHAALAEEAGLPVVRLGVWIKPNGAPQFTGDRPGTGWEAVLIMHRDGKKHWNGGGHHAVWNYPKVEGEHPTQKPLPLLKKWLTQFTDAGELVFDPFAGAASTGVACIELGRRFLGCEISPDYFAIAKKRLENAAAQLNLFTVELA